MDHRDTKQTSGGNGFIFGVLVGVAIALLFTTKKGRDILRDVSEKVIAKLSSLEQSTTQTDAVSELFDELAADADDYVKPTPQPAPQAKEPAVVVKEVEKKVTVTEVKKETPPPTSKLTPAEKIAMLAEEENPSKEVEPEEEQEKAPEKAIQGRRWFRGLKKKSN